MKKITLVIVSLVFMAVLSGCTFGAPSLGGGSGTGSENLLKSADGGIKWESKMKIDDKKTIATADILSMAINRNDPNIIYLGTVASGLFLSKDGAETWVNVKFPEKVYGLVLDPQNSQVVYASGVFNGRGKIFKRENEQQDWQEIYTEPADGTFISSLAIDKTNPQVLYAGTSAGVIIKTVDGGQRWVNLKIKDTTLNDPIGNISFDAGSTNHVYFTVFQRGLFETTDGGATISNITDKLGSVGNNGVVYYAIADPHFAGVIYVGMNNGIIKGTEGGTKWEMMNIIASSKQFPIRAIAINPNNSKEIVYAAAKAIYRTVDGGSQWATFQLNTTKGVNVLMYDPIDPLKIYAGFRKMN